MAGAASRPTVLPDRPHGRSDTKEAPHMQATRQAPVGTLSPSTIGIAAALAVSAILGISVALTGGVKLAPAAGPAAAPQAVTSAEQRAEAAAVIAKFRTGDYDPITVKSSAEQRAEAAAVIAKFRTGDYDRVSVKAPVVQPAAGTGHRGLRLRSAN